MQAGFSFALAMVYAAGGDHNGGEDEPLSARDIWGGFAQVDPRGRIRQEADLEAHFRTLRERRLANLTMHERKLQSAPAPPLESWRPSRGQHFESQDDECCCCWAIPTDVILSATHTMHVF